MSCCRVTCHLSSVMSSRGDSAALGCDIIAHLDPGHWWTLLDTGHTIMMSSSTDQWWVLGHCTHWTGGAQSAVGHTLYLVPDLHLYISISRRDLCKFPTTTRQQRCSHHAAPPGQLAEVGVLFGSSRLPQFLTSILSKSLNYSFPSELQEGLYHGLPFVDRKPLLLWFCTY